MTKLAVLTVDCAACMQRKFTVIELHCYQLCMANIMGCHRKFHGSKQLACNSSDIVFVRSAACYNVAETQDTVTFNSQLV